MTKTAEKAKEVGTLYPKMGEIDVDGDKVTQMSLTMGMHVGEASCGRKKYHLSTSMGGSIVIRSERTGREFRVGMKEALELAVERGIDGKKPIVNPDKKKGE